MGDRFVNKVKYCSSAPKAGRNFIALTHVTWHDIFLNEGAAPRFPQKQNQRIGTEEEIKNHLRMKFDME